MLRVTKSRFYTVPVLMRALDIMELLRKSEMPLKTNEISHSASIPQSTTYRILRTLHHRGYVVQDPEGRFSIAKQSKFTTLANVYPDQISDPHYKTDLSGDQVIEIVNYVLHSLIKRNGRTDDLKMSMDR